MKEATLLNITANGTWESQHGTLYQFEVTLQNPDGTTTVGECNSKSQEPPYTDGDKVWYEVARETAYGKKLKVRNSPPYQGGGGGYGGGGKNQDRIGNQWAIRDAITILQSRGDEVTYQSIADVARELTKMRDNLETYLA